MTGVADGEWDDTEVELDYDFDEAWSEHKPKRVRILGRVYTLPAELPAKVMILLIRERKTKDTTGERNLKLLEEILQTMLTPAGYDQVLGDGISLRQLGDVVDYIMRVYDMRKDDEDGEGEGQPPETGASTTGHDSLSPTGRSLRPTSRGSTALTLSRRSARA